MKPLLKFWLILFLLISAAFAKSSIAGEPDSLRNLLLRYEKEQNNEMVARTLISLGISQEDVGQRQTAIEYYRQALEKSSETEIQGLARYNLGHAYWMLGEFKEGEQNYQTGLEYLEQGKNYQAQLKCMRALGNFYGDRRLPQKEKNSSRAESYWKMAAALADSVKDPNEQFNSYYDLGRFYWGNLNTDLAVETFTKSLNYLDQMSEARALEARADVYTALSQVTLIANRYDSSITYLSQSLDYLAPLKDTSGQLYHLKLLVSAYQNQGLLQDALNAIEKESSLAVAFYGERDQKTTAIRMRLMLAQKDLEAEKTRKRARRLNYLIVCLVALVVVMGMGGVLFFNRNRKNATIALQKKELHRKEMERLRGENELLATKAMIHGQESERNRISLELHDRLGSMLATLKLHFETFENQTEFSNPQSKEQYATGLSLIDDCCSEIRRISHEMASGILLSDGLIPAVRKLQERISASGAMRVNLFTQGVEERLASWVEISVYRIIQELVSNSIRHASASEINININRGDNQLTVLVEDDGKGITDEVKGKEGMGLQNISSRVDLLQGKFSLDSSPGSGTTSIVQVPVYAV